MEKIELKLYITGKTPRSIKAAMGFKGLFKDKFKDKATLEIIDVLERPDLALEEKIMLTPTLIKKFPAPTVRIIGDLSNKEQVLLKLDLVSHQE